MARFALCTDVQKHAAHRQTEELEPLAPVQLELARMRVWIDGGANRPVR